MTQGKILIVDDDPQIRRVLRTTLVVQGYEVADARSGEDALEKLREHLANPGVQEQLAIECAFLKAFAA